MRTLTSWLPSAAVRAYQSVRMASIDRWEQLPTIAVADALSQDGIEQLTVAPNNRRIERFLLRFTGALNVTAPGTGLANRGSILGALTKIKFKDGGVDKYAIDARLARFIGECMSPSALPAIRAADAAVALTNLVETVPLWLASPRSGNPNETKYREANTQLALQVGFIPNRGAAVAGIVQGAAAALTGLQCTVEEVFDDLTQTPPHYTCFVREIAQAINGANTQTRVDLRNARFIRGIAIQQDTDQGEQQDIINNVVLRSDNRSIIGNKAVPFADLVEHSAEEFGGAVTVSPGYLFIDFQRYGRLSSWLNPYEDTNMRFEFDCQPSGGGRTNSIIRLAVIEYEQVGGVTSKPDFKV